MLTPCHWASSFPRFEGSSRFKSLRSSKTQVSCRLPTQRHISEELYRRPRLTYIVTWHFVHCVFTGFKWLSEQTCAFLNLINRIIFAKGISCVFLEFGRKYSYIIQTIITPPTVKFLIDHFLTKPHFSARLMDNGLRIRWSTGYGLRRSDFRQGSRDLFPYTEGPGWLWNPCAGSKGTRVWRSPFTFTQPRLRTSEAMPPRLYMTCLHRVYMEKFTFSWRFWNSYSRNQ